MNLADEGTVASTTATAVLAWDPAQRRYEVAPAVREHGTGDAR